MESSHPPLWTTVTPLPKRTALRAGQLTATFESGDLRYLRFGSREIIRRVYGAVRDSNWGTIPGEISDLELHAGTTCFQIRYTRTHKQNEIHFVWQAEITGTEEGRITFAFDGEAKSTFLRNRIGLCVLHPADCSGTRCRVKRADGSHADLLFPTLIEPAQPFPGIHSLGLLASEVAPGIWAETSFEGELFEMEDQRNWIDASFKTYCTPQTLPYPVEIKAGTRLRQRVQIRITDGETGRTGSPPLTIPSGLIDSRRPNTDAEIADSAPVHPLVNVTIGTQRTRLPEIGLSIASHGLPLMPGEIERISDLRLWHLRVDVRLASASWLNDLRFGHLQSQDLGLALELAVYLPPQAGEPELEILGRELRKLKTEVLRVLTFREGERTISAASHLLARFYLEFLGVPIGAGTDGDFFNLNQVRPPATEADFFHWSIHPQVHSVDLTSIAETPSTIAAQLDSAKVFCDEKPLVLSSITLKARPNPAAASSRPAISSSKLPLEVDPRQVTPFTASWTLAVIKYLAEAGAESATLFETTGWAGVMESGPGTRRTEGFPSRLGQIFPLYYTIAEVTAFNRGEVVASRSSDPFLVESLVLTKKSSASVLLANLTGEKQTVQVSGFAQATHLKQLDWRDEELFMFQPGRIVRAPGNALTPQATGTITLSLPPYGLAKLDLVLQESNQ